MIKKKYPGATLGEVGKRAGEMWKALGDKSVSSVLVSALILLNACCTDVRLGV